MMLVLSFNIFACSITNQPMEVKDSNGTLLAEGDSVKIIKDLKVSSTSLDDVSPAFKVSQCSILLKQNAPDFIGGIFYINLKMDNDNLQVGRTFL